MIRWTSHDQARWRDFVTEARACADNPGRSAKALGQMARKLTHVTMPTLDDAGRGRLFNLYRFAQTFACLDRAGRAENAKALGDKAALAALVVDPPAAGQAGANVVEIEASPGRPAPFRADIDG